MWVCMNSSTETTPNAQALGCVGILELSQLLCMECHRRNEASFHLFHAVCRFESDCVALNICAWVYMWGTGDANVFMIYSTR